MAICGVGTDLVYVPAFAEQLEHPGTRFERVFTAGERRRARDAASRAPHLAARWAAKEAVIKAWSEALYGRPPVIPPDEVDLAEIEVVPDAWRRPAIVLRGVIAAAVERTVPGAGWRVSLSHDGDHALAFVVLSDRSRHQNGTDPSGSTPGCRS